MGTIGREQVMERWDAMIQGADGMGEGVMRDTERFLEDSKVPDAKIQRRAISPGIMQGILGAKRPFIVVSCTSNPNLKPYKMYINTRDYGANLQISWFLVHQPGFWQKLAARLLAIPVIGVLLIPGYAMSKLASNKQAGVFDLNLFDEQDLRAYVSNAHHCLLSSVDKLTKGSKVETTPKIEKHSQGFLGII